MKTHHAYPGAVRATCGRAHLMVTEDTSEVTCSTCLTVLRKNQARHSMVRPVGWAEAMLDVARLVAGPPVEPYPDLTPTSWRSMRCRDGLKCSCEFCQVDLMNEAIKADWEASQQLRPHRRWDHDFGSARAALSLLLTWVQDGPNARSSQGAMQSRAQETAALGTHVQTTHRFDREPIELRRATQARDVESACRYAYAETQARRGLEQHQCMTILLDSVDSDGRGVEYWSEATGLTPNTIKAMITHGMRAVTVWLHVNGYIPKPLSRAGLDGQIERMRDGTPG